MLKNFDEEIEIILPDTFAIEEAGELRNQINRLLDEGKKYFILNLENCEFIDSTGLGVIVAAFKRCAEKNGNLRMKSLKPKVMEVFKLTRLDKVFEVVG